MSIEFFSGIDNDFYREQIFGEWFESKTVIYENQRNSKVCDSSIIVKNHVLLKLFSDLFKKYMKNYTERTDCFADCISFAWEAITKFEPNDSTWEAMATGKDAINKSRLLSYVRTNVIQSMKRMHIKCVQSSRVLQTKNGKEKFTLFYTIDIDTLNKCIDEEEKINLIDSVEESYWTKKEQYKHSVFCQWAKDNMDKILIKSQLDFLRKLKEANYGILDRDYDLKEVDLDGVAVRQKLTRIYNKILTEYRKQERFLTGGFVVEQIDNEIKTLSKILSPINNENVPPEAVNLEISKTIIKNLNKECMLPVLYDNLETKYLKRILKIYKVSAMADSKHFQFVIWNWQLDSKTIYRVVELVSDRIAFLEQRKEEEIRILEKLQIKHKVVKNADYISPPENGGKLIYMKMNSHGILIPCGQK